MDLEFLLEEQVTAIAKGDFAQVSLVSLLCPFLDQEVLRTVIHVLATSQLSSYNFFYYYYAGPEHRSTCSNQCIVACMLVPNALKAVLTTSRLPSAIQGAGCTYKALHGKRLGYLRDCLSLKISTCLVITNRVGLYWISSVTLQDAACIVSQ